jgi:hypothetical protein
MVVYPDVKMCRTFCTVLFKRSTCPAKNNKAAPKEQLYSRYFTRTYASIALLSLRYTNSW